MHGCWHSCMRKRKQPLAGFTITQDEGRAALILMTMQNPLNQPLDQYSSIPSCQYIKKKINKKEVFKSDKDPIKSKKTPINQ